MMDVRHPMKDLDVQMIDWCRHLGLAVHVLLTKSDKLKRGPASQQLLRVRKALGADERLSVQLFSALKHDRVDEIHDVLDEWLETPRPGAAPPPDGLAPVPRGQ
jgi:GTP-binding protein